MLSVLPWLRGLRRQRPADPRTVTRSGSIEVRPPRPRPRREALVIKAQVNQASGVDSEDVDFAIDNVEVLHPPDARLDPVPTTVLNSWKIPADNDAFVMAFLDRTVDPAVWHGLPAHAALDCQVGSY